MFCPKCGNKMNKDAKYCNVCGAPVQSSEIVPVSPQAIVPKSGGSKSVLVCIIVVLLGIIAAAGFYITTSLNKEQNEPLYSPQYIEGDTEEEYEELFEEKVIEDTEVSEESSEKRKAQKDLTDCYEVKRHHSIYTKGSARDSLGNEYTDVVYGGMREGSVTYNIKGEYTRLYGDYSVMKGENQTGKVWFKIYADDVMIYESEKLIYGDYSGSFDIDVTDVQLLRIEFDNTQADHPYAVNCLIDATLSE